MRRFAPLLLTIACTSAPAPQATDSTPPAGLVVPPTACQTPPGLFRPGYSAPAGSDNLRFEDVSARVPGLTRASGVAMIDVDQDGALDLALSGDRGVEAYRGDGKGNFEDVTSRWGLARLTLTSPNALAWGDVDGDGDWDLFLTRYADADELILWDGEQFQRAGAAWGLPGVPTWSTTASLGDLDGDGDLDVFVATGTNIRDRATAPNDEQGEPDLVYRNDGDRFTEVSAAWGLQGPQRGSTFLGLIADLDDDGDQDVMSIHDFRPDELFLGDGAGHFERVSDTWLPLGSTSLMGLDVADVNGDGRLDLYGTNFGSDVLYVQQASPPGFRDPGDWLSGPDPTGPVVGWGCVFIDADNDTDLDVVNVSTGSPYPTDDETGDAEPGRLVALVNHGGALYDGTEAAGPAFEGLTNAHGIARGDFDGDGLEDLLVGAHPDRDVPPGSRTTPVLLRNTSTPAGRRVAFRLRMPDSPNRFAVGARVDVITRAADGTLRNQSRVIAVGSGFLTTVDPTLHFGLGDESVATVRVRWPGGDVECLGALDAGVWELTRGAGARLLGP